MFDGFRQSMAWLHTWTGLIVSWLLYFIFVTGALGYFDVEIDRWMKPELPFQAELTEYKSAISAAQTLLNQQAPSATTWTLELPEQRNPYLRVIWAGETNGEAMVGLNGDILQHRQTGGGQWLYLLHYRLHYLPINVAYWMVCIASMIMLVALITGTIIHRKIFIDFFTFRPRKRARTWLDLHNLLSVPALPFHLMITYSGLLFLASTYWPVVFAMSYEERPAYAAFNAEFFGPGAPIASGQHAPVVDLNQMLSEAAQQWGEHSTRLVTIYYPNDAASITRLIRMIGPHIAPSDRLYFHSADGKPMAFTPIDGWGKDVRMTLVNLHEGLFAGAGLRWLYFISGLIGAGMIATGLVFWVEKRRERKNSTALQSRGFTLMERGNLGALIGLPIAIVGYFWLNRLVPADLEYRLAVEQNGFFVLLTGCIVYCLLKDARKALQHLLLTLALLAGALPFVGDLTGAGILDSLRDGDDSLLAFNLLLLLIAAIALLAVRRKSSKKNIPVPVTA